MNLPTLQQAVPGILIAAAISFPLFFFPKWNLIYKFAAAYGTLLICLAIFGGVLGHQFDFLRPEDILLELIGVSVGCALASLCQAVKKVLFKKR